MQHAVEARWTVHKRDIQTVLTFSATDWHTKSPPLTGSELREHANPQQYTICTRSLELSISHKVEKRTMAGHEKERQAYMRTPQT